MFAGFTGQYANSQYYAATGLSFSRADRRRKRATQHVE
jgi:hypothetical protein